MKKKEGNAVLYMLVGFLALFVVSIVCLTVMSLKKGALQSQKIENVVKQSVLAAAVYDTNIYGTNHSIVITDVNNSYNKFLKTLKESMSLDSDMDSRENGKINIDKFIIYNVTGNDVEVITKGDIGESKILYKNQKGIIKTPRNDVVDKTMIYSRIKFKIVVMGEEIKEAYKDATIGVVNN